MAYGTTPTNNDAWQVKSEVVGVATNGIYLEQAVTILAQIYDAFAPSSLLLNNGSNIDEIEYTAYFIQNGAFSNGTPVPISGHTAVDVSTDALLSSAIITDNWTIDNVGFNFILTPDVTEHPIFTQTGEYSFKITITPTSGNPIVFYVPVNVSSIKDAT